jgi:hypothetical protein
MGTLSFVQTLIDEGCERLVTIDFIHLKTTVQ